MSRSSVLLVLAACSPTVGPPEGETDVATDTDAAGDTVVAPAWGDGPRTVRGRAYFFDLGGAQTVLEDDVTGAEVWVLEAPELRATLDPADGYAFALSGIPDGVGVTVALSHPDHAPNLTATLPVDGADVDDVTFQAVTWTIAEALATMVGTDAHDPTTCQMVTTVSAPGAVDVWAPGQPGATVTLDPPVDAEHGPVYFNPSVLPDARLTATSTDGGVVVGGVTPGDYTWTGHAEGVAFTTLRMPCVAGWVTNASPPWGMNATLTP